MGTGQCMINSRSRGEPLITFGLELEITFKRMNTQEIEETRIQQLFEAQARNNNLNAPEYSGIVGDEDNMLNIDSVSQQIHVKPKNLQDTSKDQ